MRIQPLIDKEELSKRAIYDVYSKYADGSISIELNGKFIQLKPWEFKNKR